MTNLYGVEGRGRHAGTANTTLQMVIPPDQQGVTKLIQMQYVNAANNTQSVTVMLPIGRAKIAQNAAASQTVIKLDREPGPSSNALGANDTLVIRNDDSSVFIGKVSNGIYSQMNLTTSLSANLTAGNDVWFFGLKTDTDPVTGEAHQNFTASALTTITYPPSGCPAAFVSSTHGSDEPIVLDSNNTNSAASTTSYFDFASFGYAKPK